MKIGILGSGAVGRTLAEAFLHEGHEVMIGTRQPDKPEMNDWKTAHPGISVGQFAQAAEFGECLVLAVAGKVASQAIDIAGKDNFSGKTVIDCTNPISEKPPVNGVLNFFTSLDKSLMEQLQQQVPKAHFVKAFNSVGNRLMYKPVVSGGRPSMFICGNDDQAKIQVTAILDAFGWDTVDMGKAEAARAIEPLCMLWCIPGFLHNQWTHAFKLVKA